MSQPRATDRTDAWYQMHEIPILLGEKDTARAESIAREAEARGKEGVRIAERFFHDGTKVYDVYIIRG